jgi:hypothetical protein
LISDGASFASWSKMAAVFCAAFVGSPFAEAFAAWSAAAYFAPSCASCGQWASAALSRFELELELDFVVDAAAVVAAGVFEAVVVAADVLSLPDVDADELFFDPPPQPAAVSKAAETVSASSGDARIGGFLSDEVPRVP